LTVKIFMGRTIDVAFVFDDRFSDLFRVAAYSIARNTKADVAIYVVDCGISKGNRANILRLADHCRRIKSIEFGIPRREQAVEDVPLPPHFSSAIFYRLAIPKVFPALERVIYLDCDVVVDGDIAGLWDEDLRGCPFGAVEEDGNFFNVGTRRRRRHRLGMGKCDAYYGSGTLLIDCRKFEESRIFERVIEWIGHTNICLPCPEQDAMNLCLRGDEHRPLSPKYGFTPCAPLAESCLRKIRKPIVIHYSCFKPWTASRATVEFFHCLGLFRRRTTLFLKFWEYADGVGFGSNGRGAVMATLKVFWKLAFQPIERFVAERIRDNFLFFWKKYRRNRESWARR
jgi:lipopolysaccharide biosynthesis glycosyltransferase